MKRMPAVLALCTSVCLFGGCAKAQDTSKKQMVQTFFLALNHMLEADTLSASGTCMNGTIQLYLDQEPSLGVALLINEETDSPISFYIKDGKTYLDFMGTTSQSKASNLGIQPDEKLNLYNPFLDLSDSERMELFTDVSQENDLYTFVIDKQKLSQFIDSYGSLDITQATLQSTIKDNSITSLSLNVQGDVDMGGSLADLDLIIDFDDIQVNQAITIPYPSNLEDY